MFALKRMWQTLAFVSLQLVLVKSQYNNILSRRLQMINSNSASQGESCESGYRPSHIFTMLYGGECVSCGQTCCPKGNKRYGGTEQIGKRIREGIDATKNEFPWSVAIFENLAGRYKFICGGALLSKTVIATAAHCVWNKNLRKIRVTIGETDILVDNNGFRLYNKHALRAIEHSSYIHQDYAINEPHVEDTLAGVIRNDLAILNLVKPTNKGRLCLRRRTQRQRDHECFGIGHGISLRNGVTGNISSILQKAKVVLDYDNSCLRGRLHNSGNMLCASNAREKTVGCNLDSGSPVFCRLKKGDACSSYYLAGIFSFKQDKQQGGCNSDFTVLADMVSTSTNALSHHAAEKASHSNFQESFMFVAGEPPCSSMLDQPY